MIDLYHKFPEVVGIDCTYKTNKMGWPLYQFVVTDGFGRGRTVLFALTRREKFADIKEILQTFKRFMTDTSKTLTFTVDCATAQINALKEEFPRCSIVLCLFHVCQAFRRKFPNKLVKKWLYRMAHTRSYDRFWTYLNIISVIDAEAGAYIRRYWLRTRKYWAASCNRFAITMGNNTNNRVENAHRQLKRYLRKGDPLELTLWKIWKWIDHTTMRKIRQGQWMLCKYYNYDVHTSLQPILRRLTPFAAKKVFLDLQRRSFFFHSISPTSVMYAEGGHIFFVNRDEAKCTCWTYCAYNLPCAHVVEAFLNSYLTCDILRNSDRWTRQYNTTEDIPRAIRLTPEPNNAFRNAYERLRRRLNILNQRNPDAALREVAEFTRRLDTLLANEPQTTLRLRRAPVNRSFL
ncbi:unnamed protein product [Trichobilharzia szidati]|nr:unnamed protein product [Trichobilharzia szidati]